MIATEKGKREIWTIRRKTWEWEIVHNTLMVLAHVTNNFRSTGPLVQEDETSRLLQRIMFGRWDAH